MRGLWTRWVIVLALALLPGWRPPEAAPVTGTAPAEGCTRSSFFTGELNVVGLDLMVPAPLLSMLVSHPCPGPVFVRGNLLVQLSPTPTDPALILTLFQVRCLGGGCPVTGQPIPAAPGSVSGSLREKGLPDAPVGLPMTALFPALPAGTYQLELLGQGTQALIYSGQLWIIDGGQEGTAARNLPAP